MDDRIFDLLSTFSALRGNGHALINQIRGSLNEMRELRSNLRRQQEPFADSDGNGGGHGHSSLGFRYGLTLREAQVAILLVQGYSNSAIAEQLKISLTPQGIILSAFCPSLACTLAPQPEPGSARDLERNSNDKLGKKP